MATNIRAKLSEKNKYWIDKHRHYELKHFCLQYPSWKKAYYADRINLVEQTAKQADDELYMYLLKGVTEELSYTYLKSQLNIPCGKDMYYDRYRRFFWLLDNSRK